MNSIVKQEAMDVEEISEPDSFSLTFTNPLPLIGFRRSDAVSEDRSIVDYEAFWKRSMDANGVDGLGGPLYKKPKLENSETVLRFGSADHLPPAVVEPLAQMPPAAVSSCRQFWRAGDYEGDRVDDYSSSSSCSSMDHVRVHPKFLHSNATSHKWALGAFAELLDNSLDEICHGATFVNVDMLENHKDGSRMLLIEDNGGGMDPHKMRHCMSLGYSAKSKFANTIGQYGNGFKTSTMRLGADVIVFSRCLGKDGNSPTQSIGMLSYTFLRSTGKEDIVVPMLDYERRGQDWKKMIRSSPVDWSRNVETIVRWSPYSSEEELLGQFNQMKHQGTRVIIYNLWEDEQGELELDFDTDLQDIQIRGVNRNEKKIEMAKKFPNSRHFLTYRHSLRSYTSILYLRLPPRFQIILRGKGIEHHNLVSDMMLAQEVTYKPQTGDLAKDPNMVAIVTIGFVKDARDHIDVQGFNVYHKNRLIKPFWRVWNAAGSDGRGVIGVLEANFVEPAHDKQGFERTIVLSRLEARLLQMQKTYWSNNCHKIGYAPRIKKKCVKQSAAEESPPDYAIPSNDHLKNSTLERKQTDSLRAGGSEHVNDFELISPADYRHVTVKRENNLDHTSPKATDVVCDGNGHTSQSDANTLHQLKLESCQLKDQLKTIEGCYSLDLHLVREKCKLLEAKLKASEQKVEEMNLEQESLINVFSEERSRRDQEEENLKLSLKMKEKEGEALRTKLNACSKMIQDLVRKLQWQMRTTKLCKPEP